jgi:small conductance mechanosensitive channel
MPAIVWTDILSSILPHLVRVVVVILLAYLLWRIISHGAPRFIRLLLRKDLAARDEEEVQQRVDTLQMAVRRTTGFLIVVAVVFVVLSEVGVNIAPFLAGVGIAGIAVGFAAQHLVRDVLNGLIMLVEDWYSKGDVVRVAGIAGLVEDITLRRTVLRDLDGIVHSVPNGEITVASNFTKDWSRVNMNVAVAYGEDLDRVMGIINQVGRELADDPYWGTLVLEAPHALRVDNLGDSGIEIKVLGNTRPIKQWDVMGELRRRLKARFDQEGIEIPWPHTKVYFGSPLEQRNLEAQPRAARQAPVDHYTMEAPHALAVRERLLPVLLNQPWGLFTDLDGTLSPIAPTPEEASVPAEVKEALAALRRRARVVAVISGRPAAQAQKMVDIDGLVYVGQHGLETWAEGKVSLAPGAEEYLDIIARVADEVAGVARMPGVFIERKGITASIHYRKAQDPEAARSAILAALVRSPNASGLKITEGRKVVEVRPPLPVNKGTILKSLVKEHGLRGALYLGDDVTDMDAFYAVHELRETGGLQALGIGVVSPENRPDFLAVIDLKLTSVEEVERLLRWLAVER